MSKIRVDKAGIQAVYQQIGEQVRDIVNQTAQDTADDELDTAVDTLHQRLNAVDGMTFPREWAQDAIETLRRGEPFEIKLQ